jgi:DNA-binding IclR family transcriptional regulator
MDLAERARQGRRRQQAERVTRGLGGLDCGPIVNYSEPAGDRLAVRLRMSPDRPGIVQQPVAHDNPIYSTANGLAFLAFAPRDQVARMRRAQPFHECGMPLWSSLEELEAFLETCRDRGYAVPPFPGQELYRVSAPVRDPDGVAVAYIGAAVSSGRTQQEQPRRRLTDAVCEAAEELSARPRERTVSE